MLMGTDREKIAHFNFLTAETSWANGGVNEADMKMGGREMCRAHTTVGCKMNGGARQADGRKVQIGCRSLVCCS